MERTEYRKLHAEWYEYLSTASPNLGPEIAFWTRCVQTFGQPVLELGCGTGKVLIPLLEQGFDITGLDNSEDMLARCQATCQRKGLKPALHEQSMLEMELPRRFKLILLPSASLSLFTLDEQIRALFRRVVAHLEPGGAFVYGFEQIPPQYSAGNDHWTGNWTRGPGNVVIAWRNHHRVDPAKHTWEKLFVVEKFVDGRLVETEANERVGRSFSVDEALAYGREAGLEEFRVTHELTEEPPRADSHWLTVRCRKLA
jgi:SAM-dependent methyltransferase